MWPHGRVYERIVAEEPANFDTRSTEGQGWMKNFSRATKSCANLYIAAIVSAIFILQLWNTLRPSPLPLPQYVEKAPGWVEKQYSRDFRYMSLDPQYDDLWAFSSNSTLKVPDPVFGNGEVEALLAMMHQLHCLSSFRTALQNAYEGQSVSFDYRGDRHWPHCLDYLRQTILCFADSTLELPRIVNGERAFFFDGAQDVRKCRSPDSLLELHKLPS